MSFRFYILLILFSTILCGSALTIIIFSVNPNEASVLIFAFFYLSMFLSLIGISTIINSIIRKIFVKNKILFRQIIISFRQAILFSLLITISMALQSQKILSWWNMLLLIAALSTIELFAISKKV
ncbi:hypothetical protein KAI52_03820 [Candidatus Parcubacteria bacterium]|nr:hypothetical protein [Candidatus Parcubacteria bacterium]